MLLNDSVHNPRAVIKYSLTSQKDNRAPPPSPPPATSLRELVFPTAPERSSRLTGSVKMADCIRVPLFLLLVGTLSSVHPIQGQINVVANAAPQDDNIQNQAGVPGAALVKPGAAEKKQAAGASLPRKRPADWKLSEEAVCRDDLARLCPKHTWNNNLEVLGCLQDKKEVSWRTSPWLQ